MLCLVLGTYAKPPTKNAPAVAYPFVASRSICPNGMKGTSRITLLKRKGARRIRGTAIHAIKCRYCGCNQPQFHFLSGEYVGRDSECGDFKIIRGFHWYHICPKSNRWVVGVSRTMNEMKADWNRSMSLGRRRGITRRHHRIPLTFIAWIKEDLLGNDLQYACDQQRANLSRTDGTERTGGE